MFILTDASSHEEKGDQLAWSAPRVNNSWYYLVKYCTVPKKNPYPPYGRSSEIPRGRGLLKVKILEAKYEAKLEYPGGDGECKTKNLSWGK